MKQLTKQEYLMPVGNDCRVPSMIEALHFFASRNLVGEIRLGSGWNGKTHAIYWLLITPEGKNIPLNAFTGGESDKVNNFTELTLDSFFIIGDKHFQYVEDDELLYVLRELICFPTEAHVRGYDLSPEDDELDIYPAKIYKIGPKNEYLFPAWICYHYREQQIMKKIIPMFFEDSNILRDAKLNSLNWEIMEPGDSFRHKNELWSIGNDEYDGLFINHLASFGIVAKNS